MTDSDQAAPVQPPGRAAGEGAWWGNPVLHDELRRRFRIRRRFGPTRRARRVVAGAMAVGYFVLAGLLARVPADGANELFQVFSALLLVVLCLLTPGAAAVTIAAERQKGTWDLLLTTLLKPSEIVIGKFIGGLVAPATVCLLALPPLGLLCYRGEVEPDTVTAILLVAPTTALGLGGIGLCCSACCATTGRATAWAYFVAVQLVMVIPLGTAVSRLGKALPFVTCPFAAWAELLGLSSRSDFNAWALGQPVLYLALAAGCLWWVSARFDTLLRWPQRRAVE